ncbi:DNA gyrase inhibitor YacG [Priestia megaterium]|uniref:Uncharacterized protein n=3 Tax=Priestia TaxID=2800373 RepID=D5DTC2_PRIM1|nr:hypothetical protein BMQ_2547 [Priestia megaterium QM B1551]ADF39382.1 hypothetical protein BMD_2537 [Priestia megaterium DSM 319]MBA9038103.1 hypothetical protein [Priestia aryabhattai]MDH6654453.1 hypothetical protein [Bacillus sp. PvP124]MDP9575406.1 hypothetical protein [Bacillus sp. 1751]MDQ0805117.1 hypothetical protein [Priestia megaterium]
MKKKCPICKRNKKMDSQLEGSRYCVHCWETIGKQYDFK